MRICEERFGNVEVHVLVLEVIRSKRGIKKVLEDSPTLLWEYIDIHIYIYIGIYIYIYIFGNIYIYITQDIYIYVDYISPYKLRFFGVKYFYLKSTSNQCMGFQPNILGDPPVYLWVGRISTTQGPTNNHNL